MATIFNQMFNPDKGRERVPVHAMYGLLIQAVAGDLDEAAFKLLMDGTPECEKDVKEIFKKLAAMQTVDRYLWVIRWHANALLTDLSVQHAERQAAVKEDSVWREKMGMKELTVKEG